MYTSEKVHIAHILCAGPFRKTRNFSLREGNIFVQCMKKTIYNKELRARIETEDNPTKCSNNLLHIVSTAADLSTTLNRSTNEFVSESGKVKISHKMNERRCEISVKNNKKWVVVSQFSYNVNDSEVQKLSF